MTKKSGLCLCGAKSDFIAKYDAERDPELSSVWTNHMAALLTQARLEASSPWIYLGWPGRVQVAQSGTLQLLWRYTAQLANLIWQQLGKHLQNTLQSYTQPWVGCHEEDWKEILECPLFKALQPTTHELSCKQRLLQLWESRLWVLWIETPGIKDTLGMDLSFPKHINCSYAEGQLQSYQLCLDSWMSSTDCLWPTLAREGMYSQFPSVAGRPACTF